MPILEVDKAASIFVVKRSMRAGFAGIENELFFNEKTQMVFGDAKAWSASWRPRSAARRTPSASRQRVEPAAPRAGRIAAPSRRRASEPHEHRPGRVPAPFKSSEFIVVPSAAEDERIDVGVLIVGAGPAGLATAVRLGQLLAEDPELAEQLGEVPIAVAEKGKTPARTCCRGPSMRPAR